MKWTIRTKFLAVMTTLLVSCLGAYLFMAVTVFKGDKTQLVFDLNRSQVSNLTGELETQFNGVSEKLKIFALLPPAIQARVAGDLLSENSDLVAVSIYRNEAVASSFHQDRFLETYGLPKTFFTDAIAKNPIPFAAILDRGEELWNASVSDGPPLIGYGRLVVVEDERGAKVEQFAVVGFVKLDRLLKAVSLVSLSEVLVVNRHGQVLVQPDGRALLARPKLEDDSLFNEALALKTRVSVVTRDLGHDRVLAAIGKGFNEQLVVVAKASESRALQVVHDLTVRTLLFGSIVLTLVILAAFLLSGSLTENIAILVEAMETVARGDLSKGIRLRGRDETVLLGRSFNQMIHDLKESRDALETMNRELDHKVKERTLQLEEQNKKIKEVQEALLRTTRLASVGEIAGRAAHEVLNPLTILLTRLGLSQKRVEADNSVGLLDDIRRAWAEDLAQGGMERLLANWQTPSTVYPGKTLLQEDLENLERVVAELRAQRQTWSGDAQFMRDEGERIGKIVNGMRRMGHLETDARPHALHEVLEQCCQIMSDLFEQAGFTIERRFSAGVDVCEIDRDEILQAVTNLMRNSLQALKQRPGARRMIVSTATEGAALVIEIADDGVGISAEDQGRLFVSSFTTKSPDEGTGLGLGIARRFVREFGGDIDLKTSRPGETVFRIRLPLLKTGVAA